MARAVAARSWKQAAIRYERERLGELVHMDVKKLGRIPDGGGWRGRGETTEQPPIHPHQERSGRLRLRLHIAPPRSSPVLFGCSGGTGRGLMASTRPAAAPGSTGWRSKQFPGTSHPEAFALHTTRRSFFPGHRSFGRSARRVTPDPRVREDGEAQTTHACDDQRHSSRRPRRLRRKYPGKAMIKVGTLAQQATAARYAT